MYLEVKKACTLKVAVHTLAPGIKAHTNHTLLKLTDIQNKNENLHVDDKNSRE